MKDDRYVRHGISLVETSRGVEIRLPNTLIRQDTKGMKMEMKLKVIVNGGTKWTLWLRIA